MRLQLHRNEGKEKGKGNRRQNWITAVVLGLLILSAMASRYWMAEYLEKDGQETAGEWQQEEAMAVTARQESGESGKKDTDDSRDGEEKKVAYLTFDDGPGVLTPEYLDILKAHGARATFFLIGEQVTEETKDTVKRQIKEGHELGLHTYTHASEIYASQDTYYQDVMKVKKLLKEEFNYNASLWRFPWGSANCYICSYKDRIIEQLHGEDLEYVDWNVSAEDSVGSPSVQSILDNIKKDCFRVKDPVILMHDSNGNKVTLEALESVIQLLEEQGYSFGTISERKDVCHFGEY